MMGRKAKEPAPSAVEQAGQRNWNDAYGYHRVNARRWFLVASGAVIVTIIDELRSWSHDRDPQQIPWVIDRNGPSVLTAKLEQQMPDAARIKGHMYDWIRAWRTVTSDPLMQKNLSDYVFARVDSASIAWQKTTEWYRANQPNIRATKNTVDVDIVSVIAQGGAVWLADWTETAWDHQVGKTPQTSTWRMTFSVRVALPQTDADFKANWDGVWVTDWHIQERT